MCIYIYIYLYVYTYTCITIVKARRSVTKGFFKSWPYPPESRRITAELIKSVFFAWPPAVLRFSSYMDLT